jgi:hypothetical protein
VAFRIGEGQLKNKLIVNLKYQLYGQIPRFDFSLNIYHRNLYQVRRRTLNDRITANRSACARLAPFPLPRSGIFLRLSRMVSA